jgi:hypothetical protein
MSRNDHDHSPPAKAGYDGKSRPYGISDDDNRDYERGRLAREADEQARYRNNWGGDDKGR